MRPDRRSLAAAAESLGTPLTDRQLDQLDAYVGMLQKWGRVFNLTALKDGGEIYTHHLLDCLAVVRPLRTFLTQPPRSPGPIRLLDVGSGAGLPAVVLAITDPTLEVHAVDAVAKKASFIRQVGVELSLPNLRAHHARVEDLPPRPFDVITARAFSSLARLVELTRVRIAPGGAWFAMKGHLPSNEIDALPADIEAFHVEHLDVPGLDADRCLVWLRIRTAGSAAGRQTGG